MKKGIAKILIGTVSHEMAVFHVSPFIVSNEVLGYNGSILIT